MKTRLIMLAFFFLCQFAHVVATLWMLVAILWGSKRALAIAEGYDRVGNAVTGGLSSETISGRAARGTREGNQGWCLLCKILDYIDPGHCKRADQDSNP